MRRRDPHSCLRSSPHRSALSSEITELWLNQVVMGILVNIGKGEDWIERKVQKGFRTSQTISVSSKEIAKIEKVSREVTQLMSNGVPVTSESPSYYYTQLGALQIAMLAEAAKD